MDLDKERARLASLYASLSNDELEQIASGEGELHKAACDALNAEIARRGLDLPIAVPLNTDALEIEGTVILRKFRDLPEALLAKGTLESAGIAAEEILSQPIPETVDAGGSVSTGNRNAPSANRSKLPFVNSTSRLPTVRHTWASQSPFTRGRGHVRLAAASGKMKT
jgi:hypothetical protein